MSRKTIVMIGVFVGSIIGGFIPTFFGANFFSFSSFLGNSIGAIAGFVVAFKLSNDYDY